MMVFNLFGAFRGLFPFEVSNVRQFVPGKVPGVYLLFRVDGACLQPVYVGRSDRCLRARLLRHPYRELDFFTFEVCQSPLAAYIAERRAYLWLRPSLNKAFPAVPQGYGCLALEEYWPVLRITTATFTKTHTKR